MWNFWLKKWHWGRFSPSTSVSPANYRSTDYSTLIISHPRLIWTLGQLVAAYQVDSGSPHPKKLPVLGAFRSNLLHCLCTAVLAWQRNVLLLHGLRIVPHAISTSHDSAHEVSSNLQFFLINQHHIFLEQIIKRSEVWWTGRPFLLAKIYEICYGWVAGWIGGRVS
jgi:hypothetical protein